MYLLAFHVRAMLL